MKRSDAGSGGRKGHSNMEHWDPTAWVKANARKIRRSNDRIAVAEQTNPKS